jgi:hypothetical protein
MDKTIRKFASFDAMKAEEYRAWQVLPPAARLDAAADLSVGLYSLKEQSKHVSTRLQRTLVRLQQPQR